MCVILYIDDIYVSSIGIHMVIKYVSYMCRICVIYVIHMYSNEYMVTMWVNIKILKQSFKS